MSIYITMFLDVVARYFKLVTMSVFVLPAVCQLHQQLSVQLLFIEK